LSQPAARALLVSAPASGQGKTTVTAALARRARNQGLRVAVFKTGPDFLDPMILARASGNTVHQLDLWMCGEAQCRRLLADAAKGHDLILVEGVMGLYDGDPSSADLARTLGLPILAVIDGSAMAQTFGAIAWGLATYGRRDALTAHDSPIPNHGFHGVVANRVGSPRHAQMLRESLPTALHFLGALPRSADYTLPERHLGLLQASELADLDQRLDAAAAALGDAVDFNAIAPVEFANQAAEVPRRGLAGRRIAIARDAAFSFIYTANLDTLAALGAELRFFSPLAGDDLPDCDALWLPGGYPELHAQALSAQRRLRESLHRHHAAGKPLLAECGGMMSLFDALSDRDGIRHPMFGLLPGTSTLQPRLQALGLQAVDLGHGELRGHSFHYSKLDTPLVPSAIASNPNGRDTREAVYRAGRLTASYVHLYFASNPDATAALLQ